MTILKKFGALTGASSLIAAGIVAVAATTASAAPVQIVWDSEYYTMTSTGQLTVTGCEGGTVTVTTPDEVEKEIAMTGASATVDFTFPEGYYGDFTAAALCLQPVADGEPVTSEATTDTYVLNEEITAIPENFFAGDTVSITAKEFLPGSKVTLTVTDAAGTTVYTQVLGNADDNLTVKADVVFPESLECGTYDVEIASAEQSLGAELYICGDRDDDDTPSPSPSPSPSASASPSVSPTAPAPSVGPTTPGPKNPGRPGLPSTGN